MQNEVLECIKLKFREDAKDTGGSLELLQRHRIQWVLFNIPSMGWLSPYI